MGTEEVFVFRVFVFVRGEGFVGISFANSRIEFNFYKYFLSVSFRLGRGDRIFDCNSGEVKYIFRGGRKEGSS